MAEQLFCKQQVAGSSPTVGSIDMSKNTKKTKKILTLSKDKKLLGVAGGIAEHLEIDKSWVRIAMLILILLSGFVPGVILYFIIGSIIVPEKR